MPRFLSWTVFLIACSGDDADDAGTTDTETTDTDDTDTPGETGTDTGTPTGSDQASCVAGQNPLVIECTASLASPGSATLALSAAGAPTRTFESAETATDHTLTGWGLRASTEYTWELAGQTGTVTTGAVPDGLADLVVTTSGALFGIDAVLVYVDCGWFVMLDGDGEVIWGIPTTTFDSLSDGMAWSQADRSVLAVAGSAMSPGPSVFVENHVSGAEVLRLEEAALTLKLTHDVARWGPYTYLLGEDASRLGGFEVWEGTTHLGTFMLSDAFPLVADLNTAHVNGITISDAGEAIVSLYGFDAIIAVDADPASPTFLELLWHAAGEPGGGDDLPNPDYVPSAGDLFVRQHNASRRGDELWVFDNQSAPFARALRMTMDHKAGTLTEDASWSTGLRCLNQGGAVPIDGGVLVTCANSGDVFAFQERATSPDWTLSATCGAAGPGAPFARSTRAFPVIVE